MAYQLLRTNIALTGNIKTCCYIDNGKIFDHVTLNPISTISPIIPFDVNLDTSTYPQDIVNFRNIYKNIFYNPQIPFRYLTDLPYKEYTDSDKYISGIVDDCMMGTKRVSLQKNGKQFSFFAPLYINSENDIPSYIRFKFNIKNKQDKFESLVCSKTLKIEGSKLDTYIHKSYNNINGGNVDPRIINIDLKSEANGINMGSIRGFSVESAGVVDLKTNLPRKLLSHDMTMYEFDNILCKEFENKLIVLPYILNLCWYFNIEDFMPIGDFFTMKNGQEINVYAEYLDDAKKPISVADLDFNHQYINTSDNKNLFDKDVSLHDHELTDIVNNYKEKLIPTISKWTLSGSDNKYLFNAYLGLSEYPCNGITYSFDPYENEPCEAAHNLNWMTYLYDGISTKTNIQNKDISEENLIEAIALDKGSLNIEFSLKTMYIANSRQFKRSEVHDNIVICNGFKYEFNKDALAGLLGTDKDNISDNIKISFSYIDNIIYLPYNENKSTKSSIFALMTKDKDGIVTCCDFVIWIPRPTGGLSNIYDQTGVIKTPDTTPDTTPDVETLNDATDDGAVFIDTPDVETTSIEIDPNMKNIVFANIFYQSQSVDGVKMFIIDTNKWEHIKTEDNCVLYNIFNPIDLSSYIVNKRLMYDAVDKSLYISSDNSNTYMNRYYGWISPRLILVEKISGRRTTDDSFVYYKGLARKDEKNIECKNLKDGIGIYPGILPREDDKDNKLLPEYKWFYSSCVRYMPKYIKKQISFTDVDSKKNTMNDIYDVILLDVFDDPLIRKYAKEIYNIKLDIDADYSQYIITFELK